MLFRPEGNRKTPLTRTIGELQLGTAFRTDPNSGSVYILGREPNSSLYRFTNIETGNASHYYGNDLEVYPVKIVCIENSALEIRGLGEEDKPKSKS